MTMNIPGLSAVAAEYDFFLLDLWGVVHDGTHLYPGVVGTLRALRQAGKKIAFISNAPRRAARVEEVLNRLGVESTLYDMIMSSGEAAYDWLNEKQGDWPHDYYYIGPQKDMGVLDGLPYRKVEPLSQAGFILNAGFGTDEQSGTDWEPVLKEGKELGLPMLCLNPDLVVVKITGERYPCAGVIAGAYAALGGKVEWFGKPYPLVYQKCRTFLDARDKSRILAVGDSLDTDIPGAVTFGIDSVLVTGGILKEKKSEEIAGLCTQLGLEPTYITARFSW